MATRPISRVHRKRSTADPRHLMRFLKREAGMAPEAIAKSEGVSTAIVKQSINQIDAYRKRNTVTEMDLAIRDLVISTMPQAKETLMGLLTATELVEMGESKTGRKRVVEVEDKTTRLEAVRVVNSLIAGLQPKQAPVAVNVQQNNQQANLGGSETFEERLRRLRKQADEHKLLPPEVAGTPDYIDAGESADGDEDDDGDEEE